MLHVTQVKYKSFDLVGCLFDSSPLDICRTCILHRMVDAWVILGDCGHIPSGMSIPLLKSKKTLFSLDSHGLRF